MDCIRLRGRYRARLKRYLNGSDRSHSSRTQSGRGPGTPVGTAKSSAPRRLIGGSSLVTIVAAIVRTKVVAVFLGPAGLGLMGLLSSIATMVGTLTALGIGTSGVREIADAARAGDTPRIARTVTAVRRVVFWLGILGAILVAAFAIPLSHLTFGSAEHAGEIALLSLVVAAGAIAEGHLAVLQGFRRMRDLARVAVLGAIVSLTLTLPILDFWQRGAVVALLLVASGAALASAWWYARRIAPARVPMTWRETLREAQPFMRLGVAAMCSALLCCRHRLRHSRRHRARPRLRRCRDLPVCNNAIGHLLWIHPFSDGRRLPAETVIGGLR